LEKLHPGSSVNNPIDFLATGNAQQLGEILDAVDNDFDEIDGSVVVFGTTGMWRVDDVYLVLHEKMQSCRKPIFPILPSAIQAAEEVSHFQSKGHVNFTDEVSFGYVLSRLNKMHRPFADHPPVAIDRTAVRKLIDAATGGYLCPEATRQLLEAANIVTVAQYEVNERLSAMSCALNLGFPVVMKVVGPVHKTEVGGVVTSVLTGEAARDTFDRLMTIEGARAVLIQKQLEGVEVYVGAKAEKGFGHQVLCGLGGIFIEVFKDVSSALVPVGRDEAVSMVTRLKSYPVIKGARNKAGVSVELIIETIMRISALIQVAPEISEMDINPLIGRHDSLVAVDARILIVK
jgi:acetyltransferase